MDYEPMMRRARRRKRRGAIYEAAVLAVMVAGGALYGLAVVGGWRLLGVPF